MKRPLPQSLLYIVLLLSVLQGKISAQCNSLTVTSPCGYTLNVRVTPTQIVPSSMSCSGGYNYNVRFTHTVTVTGINTCNNGNIGVQPQIFCNGGQNNGYYTISQPAPSVGATFNTYTYTGALVTTTNPYTNTNDCATATPSSKSCNSMQFTVFGPGISTFTYPCAIALPISLLDFKAYFENNRVLLQWSTASEKNNRFFSIERSTDGLNWETVTTLEGAGTTDARQNYQAEDHHFENGLNYYRLKQTDTDESYQYSGIVFINTGHREKITNLFPNPFTRDITIESSSEGIKTITVFNQLGQPVAVAQTAEEHYQMDLNSLPPGLYLLRVQSLSSEDHYRIIKN